MEARERRAVLLVLVAVICDYVGVGMMRVTLPFYAKALGGSGTFIGAVETAYGIGQVAGALVLPRLSDVWGRRRVLLVSFAGSALGYSLAVLAWVAHSPALLLLSRLPVGLAKQTVTVSRAVVADCTTPDADRSRWMSWLAAAIAAGYSLGPFLGGQLAEHVSDGAPAMVAVGVFMLLFPIVAIILPETLPLRSSQPSSSQPTMPLAALKRDAPVWQLKGVIAALVALAVPEFGLVAHTSVTLYMFCLQSLGKGKAWLGNLTSATALLQAALAATLLPRLTQLGWSDGAVLHLGILSFAVASGVIAFFQSSDGVLLSVVPAAFAIAVLRSYPATLLSKQVPETSQGEAFGLLDLCSSLLRVAAPVAAGALADAFGDGAAFFGQALLFIVGSAALETFLRLASASKQE